MYKYKGNTFDFYKNDTNFLIIFSINIGNLNKIYCNQFVLLLILIFSYETPGSQTD